MSTILGCCAGRHEVNFNVKSSTDVLNSLRNQICIIEYDIGNKALDFYREIPGTDITEIGGKVIVTYANADGDKIRHKKFYDKHEELQKRDGRQSEEFKAGDLVVLKNSLNNPYKFRVKGPSGPGYAGYVMVQMYDSYYHKWNDYSNYLPNSLLRTEK